MTPTDHLAVLLSYVEDLKGAIEELAPVVDDPERYVTRLDRVFSEAMFIANFDEAMLDEEADEMLTEGYASRIEELRTQLA